MAYINKKVIGTVVAVGGAIGIAYYLYQKKKSSGRKYPNNAKRRLERSLIVPNMPTFPDKYALQKYFIEEIQKGEELLKQGRDEEAIDHFIRATAVCIHRKKLLPVIKARVSRETYALLLEGLEEANVQIVY